MSVESKFKEYEVDPDLIKKAPQYLLEMKYGSKDVNLGTVLTPTLVKDQPTQVQWPVDADSFYTLIFTDPDVPSRQNQINGEIEHWLVINIPGDKIEKGDVLAEYVGSGPREGSGLHRYVFLVYKQPNGKIKDREHGFVNSRTKQPRLKWKAAQFVAKHNLEGPVAGNFYQAEYDDYVPIFHAQFTDS